MSSTKVDSYRLGISWNRELSEKQMEITYTQKENQIKLHMEYFRKMSIDQQKKKVKKIEAATIQKQH